MKFKPHLVETCGVIPGVSISLLHWPNRPATPFEVVIDVHGQKHRRRFRTFSEADEYLRQRAGGWQ